MIDFESLKKFGLPIIITTYCILAFGYAVLTPPWESPDEPAHYLYAVQLAEHWRPPLDPNIRQKTTFSRDYHYISSNYEWYQPALGYVPAAITYWIVERIAPSSLPKQIIPLNPHFAEDPFANPNLFLHAELRPFSVWNGHWGVLVMRAVLALIGIVVIYAAYQIGCWLNGKSLGLVAAGWVAFLPQFTFIAASVRSDTVANALGGLVFLVAAAIQIYPTRFRPKLVWWLGLLLGLGILSKYTFLFMLPLGFLAVLLPEPHRLKDWVRSFAFIFIPILIVCGLYYLVYAEARAALDHTIHSSLKIKPANLSLNYLLKVVRPLMVELFFARFGWANVISSDRLSRLTFLIWSIGGLATLGTALHIRKQPALRSRLQVIILLLAGFLCAFLGAMRFNLSIFQPQGRFLFPALAAWSIIPFWGIWHFLKERWRILIGIAATAFMLLFNLYSLFKLFSAYYG